MTLDLSSLQKAVAALDNSINSYCTNQNNESLSNVDKETLKSGVIQNFEVAYELCWKFMKRWLEENAGGEVINALTIKELFRMSFERVLIKDVDAWFGYHKARNLTAHTYDGDNASKAFAAASEFIFDAKDFLKTLEDKND
ncbi:MAG: nucleotidyltransferase substrate binding protein [Candidatus Omnitrophica bacterium]|nr:nucleotidyltransferase substrate binding protein [Candidatus Omnitrophota bacterium]